MNKLLMSFALFFVVGNIFAADVVVSIPVQKYFVSNIVGKSKSVQSLLRATDNPEQYQVTLKQRKITEQADVFLTIGVLYEERLIKALDVKDASVVIEDMGRYVQRKFFENAAHHHDEEDEDDHDHEEKDHHEEEDHDDEDHHHKEDESDDHHDEEDEDDHDHEGYDPHIWVSVKNAPLLAQYTYEVLVNLYPDKKEEYTKNYEKLQDEIKEVRKKVDAQLQPFNGKVVLVYHPSLGYLSDEYGLEQVAIQWKGKESSAKQIKNITDLAISENVNVIFIQRGFPVDAAKEISKKLRGKSVFLNPLEENWKKNILDITKNIVNSF